MIRVGRDLHAGVVHGFKRAGGQGLEPLLVAVPKVTVLPGNIPVGADVG